MSCPRYAVVKLKEGANTVELYGLLVQHGYMEVSFVERLRDAPQCESSSSPASSVSPVSTKKRRLTTSEATSEASSPIPDECERIEGGGEKIMEKHPTLANALQIQQKRSTTKMVPTMQLQMMTAVKRESQSPRLVIREESPASGEGYMCPSEDMFPSSSPKATATPIISEYIDGCPTDEQLLLMQINQALDASKMSHNGSLTDSPSPSDDRLKSPGVQSEEEPVECKKCHVKLKISRMHCIRYHLAMHWHEKQFRCSRCTHSSHLNGNVKIHIKSNHPEGANIVDQVTSSMVDGWCKLAAECFPHMESKVVRLLRIRQQERDITLPPSTVPPPPAPSKSLPSSLPKRSLFHFSGRTVSSIPPNILQSSTMPTLIEQLKAKEAKTEV